MEKMVDAATAAIAGLPQSAVYAIIGLGGFVLLCGLLAVVKRAASSRGSVETESDPMTHEVPALDQPYAPAAVAQAPVQQRRPGLEITETASVNGFGGFCVALMLLNWVIAGFMFLASSGAIQQAVAVLIWIGGSTMFGIGALLNRTRKYRVS